MSSYRAWIAPSNIPGLRINPCPCTRALLTQEDLEDLGVSPEQHDSPFQPSSLNFDPSQRLGEPPIGRNVPQDIADKTREKMSLDSMEADNNPEQIKQQRKLEQDKREYLEHLDSSDIQDTSPEELHISQQQKKQAVGMAKANLLENIPAAENLDVELKSREPRSTPNRRAEGTLVNGKENLNKKPDEVP